MKSGNSNLPLIDILEELKSMGILKKHISAYFVKNNYAGYSPASVSNIINALQDNSKPIGVSKANQFKAGLNEILELAKNGEFFEKMQEFPNSLPTKSELNKLEQLYWGKRFFLYFFGYEAMETYIGRTILSIAQNGIVQLKNVDEQSTNYAGDFKMHSSMQCLIFDLFTENTREKGLHIKVHRKADKIASYALGIYTNIVEKGGLSGGTVIVEVIPDYMPNEDITSMKFLPGTAEFQRFKEEKPFIVQYFKHRGDNYIKIPGKGLHDREDFEEFFHKNRSHTTKTLLAPQGVFLSIPMNDTTDDEFGEFRGMVQKMEEVMNKHGIPVVGAYLSFNNKEECTPKGGGLAFRKVKAQIEDTTHFLLIWPKKSASFSLVELGMALSLNHDILLFVKNMDDLPAIMWDLITLERIKIFRYHNLNDIPTMLDATIPDLFRKARTSS